MPEQYFLLLHNTSVNLARILAEPDLARWTLGSRLSPLGPQHEEKRKIAAQTPDGPLKKLAQVSLARAVLYETLLKKEAAKGNDEVAAYLRDAVRVEEEKARL